ncbi:MAG: hypothetical protein ACT4OP_06310 [Actinomycetota bacterium]
MAAVKGRRLARLWVGAGWLGVVLSFLGVMVGWRLIGLLEESFRRTSDLTNSTLEAASTATATALAILAAADDGLAQVEISLRTAGRGVERMAQLADDLAATLTVRVPATLGAVVGALPAMIDTARVVDRTMRTLAIVGVSYEPEIPLDRSLEEVQDNLIPLAGDLRAQARPMAEVADTLTGVGDAVVGVSADVAAIGVELSNSKLILDRYEITAQQATTLIADISGRLESQVRIMRLLVAGMGAVMLIVMTVPITLGRRTLRSDPDQAGGQPG